MVLQLKVTKCANDLAALANVAYVHPRDLDATKAATGLRCVRLQQHYVLVLRNDKEIPPGHIGLSNVQRNWLLVALGEDVPVEPFDPLTTSPPMGMIDVVVLQVSYLKKRTEEQTFDVGKLKETVKRVCRDFVLAQRQPLLLDINGVTLLLTVNSLTVTNVQTKGGEPIEADCGLLHELSGIKFFSNADALKLTSTSDIGYGDVVNANAAFRPDFRFEDLGIGGLEDEFGVIFRRAFASRIFPPQLVAKTGIQHVRGVLLHGPPGTGKTLLARQIGKMLNAREPKIVSGPEILNKFVGQSEENVRALFKDAEQEYKQRGDNSTLHIVIFDEIDAICKQRGRTSDSTGVGDSVVNQLLAKLDGVEQLNNILVIGMTNRLDLIDEALLRPGRLEVHLEIKLPTRQGRLEILQIHTGQLRRNKLLAPDVDLEHLADVTKNFSGAEIYGLIKSALSFAYNRHVKVGKLAEPDEQSLPALQIGRVDFAAALREVKAAYGVSDDDFRRVIDCDRLIHYGARVQHLLQDVKLCAEQISANIDKKGDPDKGETRLVSVLLYGPPGSGKTSLAGKMALDTGFSYVKLLAPSLFVGLGEAERIRRITEAFDNAYRTPLACIVVDGIERLVEYSAAGPRFSNAVLQTLAVLMTRLPPPGHRLLVIGTTCIRSVLHQLVDVEFTRELPVPAISDTGEVASVLRETHVLSDADQQAILQALTQNAQGWSIGIRRLLAIVQMAAQDSNNAVHTFLEAFFQS